MRISAGTSQGTTERTTRVETWLAVAEGRAMVAIDAVS
jgi:hypothetical protein